MLRAFIIASLISAPAFAYELRTDSQGDVVRWSGHVEFVVEKHFAQHLDVPNALAAVNAAVAAIGAHTPSLQVTVRQGDDEELGYSPSGANENVIVVLEDWPYEARNLAATLITINTRTNEIIDADIAFNADDNDFRVVEQPVQGEKKYDVQNTLTHELGHALGLMHNTQDSTTVMYPSAVPGETSKRALAADDRAGLGALYVEAPKSAASDVDPAPQVGCSAAPGHGAPMALAVAMAVYLLTLRRRRAVATSAPAKHLGFALVAAVSVASVAQAAEPTGKAPAAEPEEIAWGEVVDASSRWVRLGTGEARVIVTDAEIEVQRCVKGGCAEKRVKVQVLGGRIGDIEQVVAHQPKLERGSQVVLTKRDGRVRVVPTTLKQ